jgi:hypothetical protein
LGRIKARTFVMPMLPVLDSGFSILERLLERPEVELVRPGRRMLAVKMPIGVSDGIDIQQPIGRG